MGWDRSFVTLVSGIPRSGTSLLMQMLGAGGVPLLVDDLRAPDEDNPRGYYEYEPVKRAGTDTAWLGAARGRAVKVIHALLPQLPEGDEFRVVFAERDLLEVLASQRRMLVRGGRAHDEDGELLMATYREQVRAARAWAVDRPRTALLALSHADLVARPRTAAARIDAFLGGGLDLESMVGCVDPALHRNRSNS